MNEILESMSGLIDSSSLVAPIIAFVAGILTSFTPCSLSTVPLVIGVVSGARK
jgi:cytochrome c-type biogenesis protein